jgi:hypothetical protein
VLVEWHFIYNEVADMRDLLRQHIMLSDREEQLKPLGLGKSFFILFSPFY